MASGTRCAAVPTSTGVCGTRCDPLDQHRVLARAVLRTAECPAVLSHISAAIEHGAEVWDIDLSVVHITRLDGRAGRREAGVEQHRGILAEDEVVAASTVSVVSPARSIVEVSPVQMWSTRWSWPTACSTAARRPWTSSQQRPIRCDRWPDSLATRIVVSARRPADRERRREPNSPRHLVPAAPVVRAAVRDSRRSSGQVIARVDFAAPALGVFLEFDGRLKYVQSQQGKTLDEATARGATPRGADLFAHRAGSASGSPGPT